MRLKVVLLSFLGLLLLAAAALFVAGRYYDKEVKAFVFRELNNHLLTPIQVENLELTFFADFPNASLRFDKLVIPDKLSKNQRDTLLYTEKLYLSFNVWDIWNKKYRITKISVNDGLFNLKYDSQGNSNLAIWKSKPDADTTSAPFRLELKKVDVQNILFQLTEPRSDQRLRAFIKDGVFFGDFSDRHYLLRASLNSRFYNLEIQQISYVTQKDVSLESEMFIDTDAERIQFKEVDLSVNAVRLGVKGQINYSDKGSVDLQFAGKNIQLTDLLASLPDVSKEKLKSYAGEGLLELTAQLKGPVYGGKLPQLHTHFTVKKGSLLEGESGVALSDLSLKGTYSSGFNGKNDSLVLEQFKGSFGPGSFSLTGHLFDFSQPQVDARVSGNINLNSLGRFAKWDGADSISGSVWVQLEMKGTLSAQQTAASDVVNRLKTTGSLKLDNGKFRLRGANHPLENANASVALQDNVARVDQLTFVSNNSDFRLNGLLYNLIPYVFVKGQSLGVEANLSSNRIDLTDFISQETSSTQSARVNLPSDIKGSLSASIKSLVYRKFNATQVQGKIILDNQELLAEGLSFNAFKGQVSGSAALKTSANGFLLSNQTTLSNCHLDQVFEQFENFGQQVITNKEIKGIAQAQVQFQSELDPQLHTLPKTMVSTAQLTIKNGELIELKVLQDLTDFLRKNIAFNTAVNVDKLASRLKRIQFSTLSNTISIQNEWINIPEMVIKSSALDLTVNGKHSFNNDIDYGLNFRLSQIFRKNEVNEFGYLVDEDTGMKIFVAVKGTTDKPEFSFDKQAAAEARRERLQAEKNTFKSVLKTGFGLYKSDSTVKVMPKSEKSPVKFELEMNDGSSKPASSTPAAAKTNKPPVKPAVKPTPKPAKKDTDDKEYNLDDDL